MKNEAIKKARELLDEAVVPTKDIHGKSFPSDRTWCAMITVRQMLEEHSCYTLNSDRWKFWRQVETEINNLKNKK